MNEPASEKFDPRVTVNFRVVVYKWIEKEQMFGQRDVYYSPITMDIGYDFSMPGALPVFANEGLAHQVGREALNRSEEADGYIVFECPIVKVVTRKDAAN